MSNKPRSQARGARKGAAGVTRPHKWAGNLDAFPVGWGFDSIRQWVDSCSAWAHLNRDDILYRGYARIVSDAASKCSAPLALWKDSGIQPPNLMGCALQLSEVVYWVHMFWAGIPVPDFQRRAAAVSAEVRGERKKVLVEFAKSRNIPVSHAAKVRIEARKAGVIQIINGKEYVMSSKGLRIGSPLPDTQNPLKDILRK